MRFFLVLFVVQASDGWTNQRPQALLAADAYRQFRNASIEWETEYLPGGQIGNGMAKYAGDDFLLEHHRAEQQTNVGLKRVHFKEMWQKNEFWHNQGGVLGASVDTIPRFYSVDPRSFGMTTDALHRVRTTHEALWQHSSQSPRMYKVEPQEDLILVQARDEHKEGTITGVSKHMTLYRSAA